MAVSLGVLCCGYSQSSMPPVDDDNAQFGGWMVARFESHGGRDRTKTLLLHTTAVISKAANVDRRIGIGIAAPTESTWTKAGYLSQQSGLLSTRISTIRSSGRT